MPDMHMTVDERNTFLDEVHIGVVAVPSPGKAPITTPVWYRYEPAGCVHFVTGQETEKGAQLKVGSPLTITVQDGVGMGAAYVSVECVVEELDGSRGRQEIATLATRYLGPEGGALYMTAYEPDRQPWAVAARPTRFLSRDYVKLGLVGRDGT